MEVNELHARVRRVRGKGHARKARAQGYIPAVFYGPRNESIPLHVSIDELNTVRKKKEHTFITLIIDDQEGERIEKLTILKELQVTPVSRDLVHADFYEVSLDQELEQDIPVQLSGKPQGVTEGGELHLLKREIKVSCLPARRPEYIHLEVSHLQIGDSVKVQDIEPIPGVTILDAEDTVIASVAAAKIAEIEEEEETVESEVPEQSEEE